MPIHVVSTSVSFVKQHPFILCCLLLLFVPPFHRLLLFFTPLLASTALCVLALVSWVPNRGEPNTSDRKLNSLFDDTLKEEDKKESTGAGDGGVSSEDSAENLEGTWRQEEAIDGERDGEELLEKSGGGRSDERDLRSADMGLYYSKDGGESEADEGSAMAVKREAELLQMGSSSSERSNRGGIQRESSSRSEGGHHHHHEKVIAKLKMAMEREVAALEASLMTPQKPTTEVSLHCREEHHHLIPHTQEPLERASC